MTVAPGHASLLARAGLAASSVTQLAGDASTRRYYRAHLEGGLSTVLMEHDEALPSRAETGAPEPVPFLWWASFYEDLGLRVPRLLAEDRPEGRLLLEDVGDESLQRRVESVGAAGAADLYREAVRIGLVLGREGTARFQPVANEDDPLTPERLEFEMAFFLRHAGGVTDARSVRPSGAAATARELLSRLCADVHGPPSSPRPMVLCHRDYHSRNLHVIQDADGEERLVVLDFQDTRRGPRAYDLASLAWDPYVDLPESTIEELVDSWKPDELGASEWVREVRLAAGQRLIKAAGTYAYMSGERSRPEFAAWLEPALTRAFDCLRDWEHASELASSLRALGVAVPESS